MAVLYLVRHGDAIDGKGKLHGLTNESLTSKGADEAVHTGKVLSDLKIDFKDIYTSPLKRATETADILSEALGVPIEIKDALKCWNLGAYVGKKIEEHKDDIKEYIDNPNEKVVNGESFNSFAKRYIKFINTLLFDGTDNNCIVVTHGRNILLTKADLMTGHNPDFNKNFLLNNDVSTEHGGYAIADGNNKTFKIVNQKKTMAGIS